jgi:hypothetical protein
VLAARPDREPQLREGAVSDAQPRTLLKTVARLGR